MPCPRQHRRDTHRRASRPRGIGTTGVLLPTGRRRDSARRDRRPPPGHLPRETLFAPPGACAELLARRGILTHVPGQRRRYPLSPSERRTIKGKHLRPSSPSATANWHATCKFHPQQRASRASPPARSAYPPSPPRPIQTGQQLHRLLASFLSSEGTGTRLALNRRRQRGGVERTSSRITFLFTAPLPRRTWLFGVSAIRPLTRRLSLPPRSFTRWPVRSSYDSPCCPGAAGQRAYHVPPVEQSGGFGRVSSAVVRHLRRGSSEPPVLTTRLLAQASSAPLACSR